MKITAVYKDENLNDVLVYGDGSEVVITEEPILTLIEGTDGDDKLHGTSADEEILGYAGDDKITAGGGNDVIDGGSGSDQVLAGGGDDTAIWTYSDSLVEDGLDYYNGGGAGNDTLRLNFTDLEIENVSYGN